MSFKVVKKRSQETGEYYQQLVPRQSFTDDRLQRKIAQDNAAEYSRIPRVISETPRGPSHMIQEVRSRKIQQFKAVRDILDKIIDRISTKVSPQVVNTVQTIRNFFNPIYYMDGVPNLQSIIDVSSARTWLYNAFNEGYIIPQHKNLFTKILSDVGGLMAGTSIMNKPRQQVMRQVDSEITSVVGGVAPLRRSNLLGVGLEPIEQNRRVELLLSDYAKQQEDRQYLGQLVMQQRAQEEEEQKFYQEEKERVADKVGSSEASVYLQHVRGPKTERIWSESSQPSASQVNPRSSGVQPSIKSQALAPVEQPQPPVEPFRSTREDVKEQEKTVPVVLTKHLKFPGFFQFSDGKIVFDSRHVNKFKKIPQHDLKITVTQNTDTLYAKLIDQYYRKRLQDPDAQFYQKLVMKNRLRYVALNTSLLSPDQLEVVESPNETPMSRIKLAAQFLSSQDERFKEKIVEKVEAKKRRFKVKRPQPHDSDFQSAKSHISEIPSEPLSQEEKVPPLDSARSQLLPVVPQEIVQAGVPSAAEEIAQPPPLQPPFRRKKAYKGKRPWNNHKKPRAKTENKLIHDYHVQDFEKSSLLEPISGVIKSKFPLVTAVPVRKGQRKEQYGAQFVTGVEVKHPHMDFQFVGESEDLARARQLTKMIQDIGEQIEDQEDRQKRMRLYRQRERLRLQFADALPSPPLENLIDLTKAHKNKYKVQPWHRSNVRKYTISYEYHKDQDSITVDPNIVKHVELPLTLKQIEKNHRFIILHEEGTVPVTQQYRLIQSIADGEVSVLTMVRTENKQELLSALRSLLMDARNIAQGFSDLPPQAQFYYLGAWVKYALSPRKIFRIKSLKDLKQHYEPQDPIKLLI